MKIRWPREFTLPFTEYRRTHIGQNEAVEIMIDSNRPVCFTEEQE